MNIDTGEIRQITKDAPLDVREIEVELFTVLHMNRQQRRQWARDEQKRVTRERMEVARIKAKKDRRLRS